jgi:hypothetical protein
MAPPGTRVVPAGTRFRVSTVNILHGNYQNPCQSKMMDIIAAVEETAVRSELMN